MMTAMDKAFPCRHNYSRRASDDTAGNAPSYTAADTATEQATQTEADTAAEEKTYTADELKDAIKEQTRRVADVDLQKRIAQADLKDCRASWRMAWYMQRRMELDNSLRSCQST